jgi:hypothetical protein
MRKKRRGVTAPRKRAAAVMTTPAESPEEKQKRINAELASRWLKTIQRRRDQEKTWRTKSKQVIDRYRDERYTNDEWDARFNILWANTETLKPAIFSRMPVPDVRRAYLDANRIGRIGATILQRSLQYTIRAYDFHDALDRTLEDVLLPGRGQAWVRYVPTIKKWQERIPVEPLPPDDDDRGTSAEDRGAELAEDESVQETLVRNMDDPAAAQQSEPVYPDGTQFDEQGAFKTEQREELVYQAVECDYVPWDLFVFDDCREWKKCRWVARGELAGKSEVTRLYGSDIAEQLTYNYEDHDTEIGERADKHESEKCALLWDVWHKPSRTMMVFAEGFKGGPVAIKADPLKLENFFPCPEPIYSIRNNKTWVPRPEFLLYQDQAMELDDISERLRNLIDACKVRGVYDQAMDAVAKISELVKKPDLTMIPIPDFRTLIEKGGLEALLSMLPIEEIAVVIEKLTLREAELKQIIYEVTGISDIVRGATKADETLGAQKLKAQFVNLRISTRSDRFQRFIRDIMRIKSEIMAEHFDPMTLKLMTGMLVLPDPAYAQAQQGGQLPAGAISETDFMQACAMIKSDKLRGYNVDIETDSTAPVDKDMEQKNRVEFITAVSTFLEKALPAIQQGMLQPKVAKELLLFGVRGFKVGGELEDLISQLDQQTTEEGIMKQLQQSKQQLAQLQEQMQKLTQENAQLKADAPAKQMEAQVDAQVKQFMANVEAQIKEASAAQDRRLTEWMAQLEAMITKKKADEAPAPAAP